MANNKYLTFNDLDWFQDYQPKVDGGLNGYYVKHGGDEPVYEYFQFTISYLTAKEEYHIYFDNSIIYFSDNVIEYIRNGTIKFEYNSDYHMEGEWIPISSSDVLKYKINGNLYNFPYSGCHVAIINTKNNKLSNINITLKNVQFATFGEVLSSWRNVIPEFYIKYPTDNKEFARNLIENRTNDINKGIPKYLKSYGLDVTIDKNYASGTEKKYTYVKLKDGDSDSSSAMYSIDFTPITNVITDWDDDNIDKFANNCNLFTYNYGAKGIYINLCWKINIGLDMDADTTPHIEINVNGDEGNSYEDASVRNTTYYYYKSYEAISGKTVAQTIRKFIDDTKIKYWGCGGYDGEATAILYITIKKYNED